MIWQAHVPVKVVNGSNSRAHWGAKARIAKRQRTATRYALVAAFWSRKPALPCVITLTRVELRGVMDPDGCMTAMKHVIDGIADWLAINDKDPRVTWKCAQEKPGNGSKPGVRIDIQEGTC